MKWNGFCLGKSGFWGFWSWVKVLKVLGVWVWLLWNWDEEGLYRDEKKGFLDCDYGLFGNWTWFSDSFNEGI
jgi:hypothetical protein